MSYLLVQARYVRIHPTGWHGHICLRAGAIATPAPAPLIEDMELRHTVQLANQATKQKEQQQKTQQLQQQQQQQQQQPAIMDTRGGGLNQALPASNRERWNLIHGTAHSQYHTASVALS